MRFKFFSGDLNWESYGGTWLGPKQNNGEFDYWLAIRFTNMLEESGDEQFKHNRYNVELLSISPSEAGAENLKRAFECIGAEDNIEAQAKVECQIDALLSYGVYAHLKQWDGNNARKLLKAARDEAKAVSIMYGFYMDRQQNHIGDSGWDFQRGDIGKALRSYQEAK